ncbi:MAG: hypothetical protein H6Q13_655 [Bacteroidetes bacterium]|jgi:hypothetical protein|nr:hypothetical protein [Bacteroidota bacterium]
MWGFGGLPAQKYLCITLIHNEIQKSQNNKKVDDIQMLSVSCRLVIRSLHETHELCFSL